MNLLTSTKFAQAIEPGVIQDNAAFTSNVIDRASFLPTGAKGVLFVVAVGSIDAAASVFKVVQSDTKTNDTTLGGTPSDVHDVTTKPGASDDSGIWLVYVPWAAWENRYLQLQVTAGDGASGTYLSAIAIADMPGTTQAEATALGASVLEIA